MYMYSMSLHYMYITCSVPILVCVRIYVHVHVHLGELSRLHQAVSALLQCYITLSAEVSGHVSLQWLFTYTWHMHYV